MEKEKNGIKVTETKVVEVRDSNDQVLQAGYPIMLRIKGEDIVCRFKEIGNGYFVTETLDGEHENKYRQGSIESCKRISGIEPYPAPKLKAAADPVLAPAT